MTAPPEPGIASDAELVAQSGPEPERFAILYDRHFAEIHRYVAGRLGWEVAEDVAADTFLIAFRKRASFDPERGAVRPWLYGIATHLVAEHRRAERRRLKAMVRVRAEEAVDGHEERVAAMVAAETLRPELARAVRALSPGDRDVLFLTALGGLSYEEVGQALGIPEGTVGSRLTRARKRLRQALGGTNPVKED